MSDSLPIYDLDLDIVEAMESGGRLVLSAPTGSGKSTQVPQILLDGGVLGDGLCVILQPRRLAARMLAKRVAEERGGRLGDEVGYQIRLDNVSSRRTRILFVTEGILLRRMLAEPSLPGISAILFDEFHERHLYGDITLARALDLQETQRPDLSLGVMSATLDGDMLERYLDPCVRLSSEGRTFPVEVEYLPYEPKDDPCWELAADAVSAHFDRTEGDILVFMPGAYEISRSIREIQARVGRMCPVYPLHGEMPAADQDRAVAKSSDRKIIVSTNVAETSLTIDGVRTVIDAGLARVARYDPHRGINTLLIEKISKASAAQRAGRAGRTAPGRCIRLWSARSHELRHDQELPEVKRLDLAETVLTLKAAGVHETSSFRWIEAPEEKALARAELLLSDLGAVDPDGKLNAMGRRMLSFPVHPRYARMFLAAGGMGCVRAAALIAALTQSRSILLRTDRKTEEERLEIFGVGTSDFFVHMRAYQWAEKKDFRAEGCRPLAIHAESARQIHKLFHQFLEIAKAERLDVEETSENEEAIAKCVLAGFADQVARRRSGGTLQCDIVHGRRGLLARQSIAQNSSLLVASEINEIEGRDGDAQVILSMATEIQEPWLREMFPHDFSETNTAVFDATQNRVVLRKEKKFRDLVLEARDRDAEPSPLASACLARSIQAGDLRLNGWDDAASQWIERLNFLSAAMPELEIRPIGPEEKELLVAELCEGAVCYRDVKDKPVLPALRAWLSGTQLANLEKFAPERLGLPGGRKAKITYTPGLPPTLAARIQDLYGLNGGLAIAAGRCPLTIQILAPNHRPVQVTSDLRNFWKESYPKLKLELQRKYPKHEWRENPCA
ncbi:MAG: ATP-dependent helicase HrpB [Terrimicrobiaceae bacterium]